MDYLTVPEVCVLARISRPTLARWIRSGLSPAPVKLGPRSLRFSRAAIEQWLATGAVQFRQSGVVPFLSAWLPEEPTPDELTAMGATIPEPSDLAELDTTE